MPQPSANPITRISCTGVRMRTIGGVILLGALSLQPGCSDDPSAVDARRSNDPVPAAASQGSDALDADDAAAAGLDAASAVSGDAASAEPMEAAVDASVELAAPRVKPRLVTIELPMVMHRSVELGEDGLYDWGPLEPLDEVTTCVIERRGAYAIFEPYEPLDEPICTTTGERENAVLSVPPNSDLTITISKQGYLPAAVTQRVETEDILAGAPSEQVAVNVLFEPEQAELFSTPNGTGSDNDSSGFLTVEYAMYPVGFDGPGSSGQLMGSVSAFWMKVAQGGQLALSTEPAGTSWEAEMPRTQLLLDVPTGIYRAQADHSRANCEPLGIPIESTYWGLTTDAPGQIELRVLPGHVTSMFALCLCFAPSPDAVSLDAPSCTFEIPQPAADAGAPSELDASARPQSDAGAQPDPDAG